MDLSSDHKYSLLYLDDDFSALTQMRLYLQQHLDLVAPAYFGSPQQALSSHFDHQYDIVISDLRLGTTTGIEVVSKMKEFAPDSAYILISGDADTTSVLTSLNDMKALKFLTKPLDGASLSRTLHEAIEYLTEQNKLREISLTESALDRMGMAVARFNQSFKLLYANTAARQLIESSNCLRLGSGDQLISDGHPHTAELHSLVKASFVSPKRQGWPIACGQDVNDTSLIMYPLIRNSEAHDDETAYDLLLIDPSKNKATDPASLAEALKITLSEARVVYHLSCGLSLEDTAEACNLQLSTVRTYLKTAFGKTGTSRQAELVSKALRVAP